MTADEMIQVIQAWKDGKGIETSFVGIIWSNLNSARFNFIDFIYRIKPDPPAKKYRPFKNAEEFKPHRDKWVINKHHKNYGAWKIQAYGNDYVSDGQIHMSYKSIINDYIFDDGSPCGVEE